MSEAARKHARELLRELTQDAAEAGTYGGPAPGPFAHGAPAGDDHTWIRPASPPCPDCECCTAALCARGREHALGCGAACRPEDWETVRHCPCSAASTPGTAGHHLRAAIARRDSPAARKPHPYERIPYAETAGLCWCGRVEEHRLHIPLDHPHGPQR